MTYFKRHSGVLSHFEFMDPRALHAIIDQPVWWSLQRDSLARVETIIDLSAQPIGDRDDPLAKVGVQITATPKDKHMSRIVEQSGIRGLALHGKYELQLPTVVEQIDVLIAHFGHPPTLTAIDKGGKKVTVVASERPRQVELLRLLGSGLTRISIDAPDSTLLVQICFPGHTRDGKAAAAATEKRKKE